MIFSNKGEVFGERLYLGQRAVGGKLVAHISDPTFCSFPCYRKGFCEQEET